VAHQALQASLEVQRELAAKVAKAKTEVKTKVLPSAFIEKVRSLGMARLTETFNGVADKKQREGLLNDLFASLTADLTVYAEFKKGDAEITAKDVAAVFEIMQYELIRKNVFEKGVRVDGRGLNEIRALASEVGILERPHGTGLFTRGQTQCLAFITLGTKIDEQMIESLNGTSYRKFMLHYNFPPYSVGETKPMRGPGRREIGHGALAEKALIPVIPSIEEFPYTITLTSEVMSQNGSSSMASTCGSTLSLMDAGVPIKDKVAGISVGMVSDGAGKYILLTYIYKYFCKYNYKYLLQKLIPSN